MKSTRCRSGLSRDYFQDRSSPGNSWLTRPILRILLPVNIESLHRHLAPLLSPFAPAYGAYMRRRAREYARGKRPQWRPSVPCVSVGNISVGGSGKTPLAQWILRRACELNLAPLLLTRGYGAKPPELPYLVTPGSPPAHAGDEPLMLAQACQEAHVVVDPKRMRSGPWAMERFGPKLVVLDDGFQHLAVKRDLDLVLLTPGDLGRDWDRTLPGGRWREDATALARASAVLLKVGPDGPHPHLAAAGHRLPALGKPVYPFALKATGLVRVADGSPADLDGTPYALACGVAKPRQVAATAQDLLGAPPVDVLAFPDHHAYTLRDLEFISARARDFGAAVVVTPKDAVKLKALGGPSGPDMLTFALDLAFFPGLYAGEAPDFPAFFTAWAAGKGLVT